MPLWCGLEQLCLDLTQTRITREHREAEYSAEKDSQSIKKFHSFHETVKFPTALTTARL